MKKRLFYISVIVICLAILSGGTLAYFNATDTARNVITSGAVAVEVIEQQLVDGVLQPYPNEPVKIMPGTTVSKVVTVQSTEESAWLRASYVVTVYDASGEVLDVTPEEVAEAVTLTMSGGNRDASDRPPE